MKDNRTLELAKRLKVETENKKINWAKSTYANSYRLSLGNGMVVLDYNPDKPMLPLFSFSILNENGTVVDSLAVNTNADENYKLMVNIFNLAENNYMKIDETFKSMFDALDLPF